MFLQEIWRYPVKSIDTASGQVLVDGRAWQGGDVARDVEAAAGPGTQLAENDLKHRFDIQPLLVTTDGMLGAVGYDRRRFRMNLVIAFDPDSGEQDTGVLRRIQKEFDGRLGLNSAVAVGGSIPCS